MHYLPDKYIELHCSAMTLHRTTRAGISPQEGWARGRALLGLYNNIQCSVQYNTVYTAGHYGAIQCIVVYRAVQRRKQGVLARNTGEMLCRESSGPWAANLVVQEKVKTVI